MDKKNNFSFFIFISFAIIFSILSYIKDPWQDELFTKYLISNDFGEILNILKNDNNAPLYYYILHIFHLVFGKSIFSLRIFSIILILVSGVMGGIILKNLSINKIPFYIFYLFPLPLYFSSEARCYALIIFLSTLLFYEITGKKRFFPLILYSVLLNYTHYLSFLYIIYFLYDLIFYKKKQNILIIAFIILLSLPLFFLIKDQPIESLNWTKYFLKNYSLFTFFSFLFIYTNINLYSFQPVLKNFIFSIFGYYILFLSLWERLLRYLSIPFALNFIIIFSISYLYKNIYVPLKVESFFFVPFFIFISKFLSKSGKTYDFVRNFFIIILILLFAHNFLKICKPNLALIQISNIINDFGKDANICTIGIWGLTIEYLLEKEGMENKLIIFPPSQNSHLGWCDFKLSKEDINILKKEIIESNKPYLVLWHKDSPYLKRLKDILPPNITVYLYNDFYFFYKK